MVKKNINEYSPPSLNLTSLEYYNDFYKKELRPHNIDNSILKLTHYIPYFDFFMREYFDEQEKMYSREIYVFINPPTNSSCAANE